MKRDMWKWQKFMEPLITKHVNRQENTEKVCAAGMAVLLAPGPCSPGIGSSWLRWKRSLGKPFLIGIGLILRPRTSAGYRCKTMSILV